MDSSKDPRSIDWTPKQIQELKERITRLEDAAPTVSELEPRITTLEKSVETDGVPMSRDWLELKDRIDAQRKALASQREAIKHHSLKLERIDGLDLEKMTVRLDDIERRMLRLIAAATDQSDLVRRISVILENHEIRLPPQGEVLEFSPPIGGIETIGAGVVSELHRAKGRKYQLDDDDLLDGIPDVHGNGGVVRNGGLFEVPVEIGQETKDRITAAKAMRAEAYDRGFSSGKVAALAAAERRVRAALEEMGHPLEGHHVDGVINALRGEKSIKDNPGEVAKSGGHRPERGDEIEAWIKAVRDGHLSTGPDGRTEAWYALDDLLDDYRLHADTGTPMLEEVQGPHPEV